MEWLLQVLGYITGSAVVSVGEKLGNKVVPAGRPMDKLRTARRLKGDMAELYKLYTRLSKYADQADDTCNAICNTVVAKSGLTIHSPIRDDAFQLCQNLLIYGGYFPLPEIDFTKDIPLGKIWDHTKAIKLQLELYQNPKRNQEIMELLEWYVQAFLPQFAANGDHLGYAQFVDMHDDPAGAIDSTTEQTTSFGRGQRQKAMPHESFRPRAPDHCLGTKGAGSDIGRACCCLSIHKPTHARYGCRMRW
jgi:hypothetical protein